MLVGLYFVWDDGPLRLDDIQYLRYSTSDAGARTADTYTDKRAAGGSKPRNEWLAVIKIKYLKHEGRDVTDGWRS